MAPHYLNSGQRLCYDQTGRLPTINELESLVDASCHSPALAMGHPFTPVADAYWSSTTSAYEPDWAKALYLAKGAVGVGQKAGEHFHAWAVCSPKPWAGPERPAIQPIKTRL